MARGREDEKENEEFYGRGGPLNTANTSKYLVLSTYQLDYCVNHFLLPKLLSPVAEL